MASYEKRGKKTRVVISVMDKGVRKKVSKTFNKKSDAKDWAMRMEIDKADNRQIIASQMLLSDYFKQWYETYKADNIRNATLYSYTTCYNLIVKYYPNLMLNNLSYTALQEGLDKYAKDGKKERSKSTVAFFMKHIKASLNDALTDDYVEKDVWSRLKANGTIYKHHNYLSAREFEKLRKYCYEHWRDSQTILAVLIAIETGLRVGEIMFLGKDEIFPNFNAIYIKKSFSPKDPDDHLTKSTQSIRKFKVPYQLSTVLAEATKERDPIFTIPEWKLRVQFIELLEKLDIQNITFHGLRHSHVSYLLYKGVSMQYISQRIGHANINTTAKTYTHLLKEQKEKEESKAMEILSVSPDVPKKDKEAR
ncbi:site-specific integrase [Pediococcus ethanolidurans]|uniref:Integrase n=1 Tax=Pediococcus ethanolidurans TaxID=319653 RepID=A0A0R2K3B1_9LACO|nr:site-specific integrase [Pediococcus ethanolidurans]KRN81596.1 integrase [Pediococcus ethanolidurans]GEN95422.1 site-specific integrase [Pediococcus ethanolidurans]SER69428.1 Site-specific recombinase XerD [Pediococcus ethanolidurans]